MTDLIRQEVATAATILVVKVGTRVLTNPDGTLNEPLMARLADEICQLRETGKQVVVVSSGAVGAGIGRLGLTARPRDLARLQAVAAVGQTQLIEVYDRVFRRHGRHAAQVLLTADDFDDRVRYLNVRNTLRSLLEYGTVPIINENDTVAVDELMTTFGDNDRLAALVTNLLLAPLLIILSDVAGLYDGPPEDADSKVIPLVPHIDSNVLRLAQTQRSAVSKGGMASKLNAGRSVTTAGENMIIASGHHPGILSELMAGQPLGTLFLATGKSVSPWKRWIGFSAQARGTLVVDPGASRAIVDQGSSLLAIGVTGGEGNFEKGDVVAVYNATGEELARGLTNYSSAEIQRIRGLKSDQIGGVLGHCPYEEVIHRDNLAIL